MNSVFRDAQNHPIIQKLIKELQHELEARTPLNHNISLEEEELALQNQTYNEKEFITSYRDKMLLERNHILNHYQYHVFQHLIFLYP